MSDEKTSKVCPVCCASHNETSRECGFCLANDLSCRTQTDTLAAAAMRCAGSEKPWWPKLPDGTPAAIGREACALAYRVAYDCFIMGADWQRQQAPAVNQEAVIAHLSDENVTVVREARKIEVENGRLAAEVERFIQECRHIISLGNQVGDPVHVPLRPWLEFMTFVHSRSGSRPVGEENG